MTAFWLAVYGDPSFYRRTYEKYRVTDHLDMEMEDVLHVTQEMLAYLVGEREVLSVETMVEGQRQDFFGAQDRLHMEDVRGLFLGGLSLRNGAFLGALAGLLLLALARGGPLRNLLSWWRVSVAAVFLTAALLAVWALLDFTSLFTLFHKVFFRNDLWLFDPTTDYMIRMLPEGFFLDMAGRIGGIFLGLLTGVTGILQLVTLLIRRRGDI